MNRRASKTRLRTALAGVLLLAANAATFAAFTWPRLTRVRRAESRAREVSARRADLESLWSQVQARKEILAQNRRDIESLNRDHLKDRAEDLFAAQREIEALARDAGLKPKKSSYSLVPVKGTDLVRCEVTLPLDGTYASLTGFLARIQSARRFFVVDQMALAHEEAGARMNLKLSAVFKEGESRAAR
jgi:hypothetical protein